MCKVSSKTRSKQSKLKWWVNAVNILLQLHINVSHLLNCFWLLHRMQLMASDRSINTTLWVIGIVSNSTSKELLHFEAKRYSYTITINLLSILINSHLNVYIFYNGNKWCNVCWEKECLFCLEYKSLRDAAMNVVGI